MPSSSTEQKTEQGNTEQSVPSSAAPNAQPHIPHTTAPAAGQAQDNKTDQGKHENRAGHRLPKLAMGMGIPPSGTSS